MLPILIQGELERCLEDFSLLLFHVTSQFDYIEPIAIHFVSLGKYGKWLTLDAFCTPSIEDKKEVLETVH